MTRSKNQTWVHKTHVPVSHPPHVCHFENDQFRYVNLSIYSIKQYNGARLGYIKSRVLLVIHQNGAIVRTFCRLNGFNKTPIL